jgi:hypothetical protein
MEGHVMEAVNVLPLKIGWGPMDGLAVSAGAEALPDDPRGLISLVLRDGTWRVFAFTESTVEAMDDQFTWDEIGSGYACTGGDDWSALHFGSFLLATNTTDGLIAYNVEAPAGFSAISAAGSPRYIFVVANVIVALDCLDKDGARDNRLIRNSDFNDHTDWSGGAADYQPLEDGGALVFGAAVSETTAIVLQEGACRLMQFGNAGGGALYSLRVISTSVGSVGAKSCVAFDNAVYWLATDGFRKFTLANGVETIGAGLIDTWFYGVVDQSNLNLVQAGVDPLNKIIWWRFPRLDATSLVVFDDLLGYSWQWKRWCTSDEMTAYLGRIATPGVTTDGGMDDYGVLDDIEIPLDSRVWQGGQPVFGALDADLKFATFTGSALASLITTPTINSPVSGLISSATSICDAACTLELGVKDDLSGALTWKAAAAKQASGRTPLRGRGKNIAFRRRTAADADWSFARGIDHVESAAGGRR